MADAATDSSNARIIDGGTVGDLRAVFDLDEPQQDPLDDAPFQVALS
jgi:hypothetical protein